MDARVGSPCFVCVQANGSCPGVTSFFFQTSQVVSSWSTFPSRRNRKTCLAFVRVDGIRLSKESALPSHHILEILNFSPSERQKPDTANVPRLSATVKAAFESSSSVIHVPTRHVFVRFISISPANGQPSQTMNPPRVHRYGSGCCWLLRSSFSEIHEVRDDSEEGGNGCPYDGHPNPMPLRFDRILLQLDRTQVLVWNTTSYENVN